MKLPSKKIIPIIVACIAAGGTITFAATYQPQVKKIQVTHLLVDTTTPDLAVSNDTSWKNSLQNIEGSTSLTSAVSSDNSANTPTQSLTKTDQIAQSLLSTYMQSTQNGQNTLSSDAENQIVNQAIVHGEFIQSTTTKQYQTSDLTLEGNDSTAVIQQYGNAVALAIINNGIKNGTDSEMSIMDQATQNNDPATLKRMGPIIASYKSIVKALLKVPTPPSAIPVQLNLINDFTTTISIDTRLENYLSDPADALYALKDYETISVSVYQDIVAYSTYLQDKGIVYSQGDPAFRLVNQ